MRRSESKNEKIDFQKWEGPTLNMESLSQNREALIQKHGRSDSKNKGFVDTSQPSYIIYTHRVYSLLLKLEKRQYIIFLLSLYTATRLDTSTSLLTFTLTSYSP